MPRFVPENVGLVDYGQNYAARSGGNVGADGGGTDGGGGGGDGGGTLGTGRGVGGGAERRVLFAFSGYTAPTFEPGCDQAPSFPYLFPRGLSIRVDPAGAQQPIAVPAPVPAFGGGGTPPRLVVSPVPELNAMRGAHLAKGVTHTGRSTPIARGATIDVIVTCKATTESTNNAGASSPTTGRVVVWVLAAGSAGGGSAVTVDNAADNVAGYWGVETEGDEKAGASPTSTSSPSASEYLEIGYDFGQEELYVDHGHIGNATIRQGAPLPRAHALLGVPSPSPSTSSPPSTSSSTSTSNSFELIRVLVDNAMIETFAGGVATASFVSPPGATKPADRGVMFVEATADRLACSVDVWSLALPAVL